MPSPRRFSIPPSADGATRLVVKFADTLASIDFDDRSLAQRASSILRHCVVPCTAPTNARAHFVFQVESADESTCALISGDTAAVRGLEESALIERLIYEISLALGTGGHSSLVFHAAGLSSADRGIVLCGKSGCGKSTLSTALILAGFDFLSDELVAIRADATRMDGFPRAIALKDLTPFGGDVRVDAPDAVNATATLNGMTYLDPCTLRPGSLRRQATPRALVFPLYSTVAPPEFRRLSPAETAFLLLPRLVNTRQQVDRGFRAVTGLARMVSGFRLVYRDLAQAIAWLAQIVGE